LTTGPERTPHSESIFELLVAEFAGRTASHLLIGERYLELPPATLRAEVEGDTLRLASDAFARQVIIDWPDELDGLRVEDNYVDLLPGRERRIGLIDRPRRDSHLTIRALNAEPVMVLVPANRAMTRLLDRSADLSHERYQ
jgi:hypothetical protein